MTRALCLRSSKRKPVKSSQDLVPEDCKENSPAILIQPSRSIQNTTTGLQPSTEEKENISPKGTSSKKLLTRPNFLIQNLTNSPIRKSSRRLKSSTKHPDKPAKALTNRNVLCDTTNSPRIKETVTLNEQIIDLVVKRDENKSSNLKQCVTPKYKPRLNSKNENHVPVYKTVGSLVAVTETNSNPSEKKEAVYEFEVDENEDPVPKKKRQRKVNIRKPKIGPRALTINNIKYSSTESLASLTDKPVTHKKKATKAIKSRLKIKPCSSVTRLNDCEESVDSAKSFMPHLPSLIVSDVQKPDSNRRLSVLQETISEQFQSPLHQVVDVDVQPSNNSQPLINETTSSLNCINIHTTPRVSSTKKSLVASVQRCFVSNQHTLNPVNIQATPSASMTNKSLLASNTRCYVSKRHTPNPDNLHRFNLGTANNTLPHQVSSGSVNVSTTSACDFLSSTPCKRASLVVSNNSIFDDSYDLGLPSNFRPSTGYIKDTNVASNDGDSCFGFDGPEELEVPLLSPIKSNIDLQPKKPLMVCRPLDANEIDRPQPSAREIIEMLKASIPKAPLKEQTDVFDTSVESSKLRASTEDDEELLAELSFKKPPRRSYERERRIRHYSEHEEESEEEMRVEEVEEPSKPIKKCYKHKNGNSTKSGKAPKATKAQQKIAKEEEELERLAAQMNAQFQKIEKVSLVVE